MKESCEQQARNILERMGIAYAQQYTAGELVELVNLIQELNALRMKAARDLLNAEREEPRGDYAKGLDDGIKIGMREAAAVWLGDTPAPRLVEVEWPNPTLDQMPEWEPHRCSYPVEEGPNESRLLMRDGGQAHSVLHDGAMGCVCGTARLIEVLDADPIKPTTAKLLPGMIAEVNGRLSICTKQFALVDLADGGYHSPALDTPIAGKVWRLEGQDSQ